MIRKIIKGVIGLTAFSAAATVASAVYLGNRRVDEWETLTLDDADEGDFVTLPDGARMHYVQRGAHGDPVILIHGLMGSTHDWKKNIDALAQDFRVWAIDLIGFGFSSRVTEPKYTLEYLARAVRDFMDAQKIKRAHIVGHSLGGAITLRLAHDYPARVNKLILIDPAAYVINVPVAVNLAARVPFMPRALMGFAMTSARARETALRSALGDPQRFEANEAHARMRAARVKGTADALVAMTASPNAGELPELLRDVAAPALIVWGDKDLALPLRHGERLARDLPNAEFVILEGAGHVPHEEFPEMVNPLMRDFLKKEK